MSVRALLLDLEGTAVSISFVKDTLFPYANENVEKFLSAEWDTDEVRIAVEGMRQQSIKDTEANIKGAVSIPDKNASKEDQITAVSKSLVWLNNIGSKATHMKDLSGFIWRYGYENGDIKGHVFDDVEPAIRAWKKNDKKVYIYSSGSVLAQKLLMKYSISGDLEPLIDGYFDTAVGNKREVTSYKNILEKIELKAEEVLFLTDIVEEGNAASEAGINVTLLSREGNAPLSEEAKEKFTVASSFAEIDCATTLKRKLNEEEDVPPTKIPKTDKVDVQDNSSMDVDVVEVKQNPEEKTNGESTLPADTVVSEPTEKIIEPEIEITDKPDLNLVKEAEKLNVISEKTDEKCIENSDKDQIVCAMETDESDDIKLVKPEEKTILEPSSKDDEILETDKSDDTKIIPDLNPIVQDEKITAVPETTTEIKNVVLEKDTTTEVIPSSLPITDVPIVCDDNEKLDELLGAKGIALAKECEQILSKVEEVTNLETIASKKILTENTDPLDEAQGNSATETLLDVETNGDKISVEDLVSTVTDDVLDEILPQLPSAEDLEEVDLKETTPDVIPDELTNNKNVNVDTTETPIEPTEVVKADINENENIEVAASDLNGDVSNGNHDITNGKNGDSIEEVNGKGAEIKNGNGVAEIDHKPGTNGTAPTTDIVVDEQKEIKVKKIPTEETILEKTDQAVEA